MIKFRAWDNNHKAMHFSENAGIDQLFDWVERHGGAVMQFTGLKDKNRKEIYEGDIVRLRCGGKDSVSSKMKIIAVIEWCEWMYLARIIDKKIIVRGGSENGKKHSLGEIHSWCGMHNCFAQGGGNMEIIGNIHDNPELLK